MNLPNIIIGGHINAGKSTIAKYLVDKYNYNKFSLGDKVKNFIVELYKILHILHPEINEIDINELYDRNTKEQHRQKMQLIATDLMRNYFNDNIWIDSLFSTIKYPFVIDDLRFINEYEYFKKISNVIYIRVIRDNELKSNHSSEQELNDIKPDYLINNNEDIQKLFENIDKIMNDIIKNELNVTILK